MIKFLFKGIIRDRSRSLFPFLVVVIGVMLTVFFYCWLKGAGSDMISASAHFNTGHVKVMTRAYAAEAELRSNDLALLGLENVLDGLKASYPDIQWVSRINFGGLLDVPDAQGETLMQGPAAGMAIDMFSPDSWERNVLNLEESIVRGRLPERAGEILISEEFARRLGIGPGRTATLITSTMYGSMSMANFKIAGTVRFGVAAMDRSAVIADILDIQNALDMEDGAGEILGFFADDIYRDKWAVQMAVEFNARAENGEYSPVMKALREQSGMGEILDMLGYFSRIMLVVFMAIMSIVLWNAGLIGSLRRYGEIGVRLAIGENKSHVFRSMIYESMIIGFFGSIVGTAVAAGAAYYVQVHGLDISYLLKDATFVMSNVMRARVTGFSFVIGFIPGLGATILGTMFSGIGIYRRQTSQLFKELEV